MATQMPTITMVGAPHLFETCHLTSCDKVHGLSKDSTPTPLLLLLTVFVLNPTDDHQIFG